MKRSKLLAIVGAVLLASGVIGSASDAFPLSWLALPPGIACLIAAFVLVLRRRPPDAAELPIQDRSERRRAFYVRLAVMGFLMIPGSLLLSALGGDANDATGFIVPAGIAATMAIAIGLFGRPFIPAMVFAAMLVFGGLLGFELELRHPESFGTFAPALWLSVGGIVAFIGATVAFAQRRRRSLRPATMLQRGAVVAGAFLLIAGTVASWTASGASRVTAAKAGGTTVINMGDNEFRPKELRVEAGKAARFFLHNEDGEAHTFTIDDLALDEYIGPRGDRLIKFAVPRSMRGEELALTCLVGGHEDMDGTVLVETS